MTTPYISSRIAPHPRKDVLSRTLFFWFASLAFIALSTPALAVYMRGLAGFLIILVLAILAGLVESSFNWTLHSISKGISQNKLFYVFVIWYLIGFVLNVFIRGGGLDDWRLMLSPLIILISLFYAFAFMQDDLCYRYFQISLILVIGVQSFFSAQILLTTVNIARIMWSETSGAWIYGNQAVYASYAVIVPLLLWRSFRESGILRLLLVISCLFMLIASSISSFATPLALAMLSGLIILILSVFMLRRKSWTKVVLLAGIIPTIFLLGYRYTYENPFFYQAYFRIENIINDPRSGGYSNIPGAVSRWELANISINTFEAEPLFGKGGPREYNPYIGRHSSFFDSLAIYGLLGGGGALCGIILISLANATRRFLYEHTWEALLSLTIVILLTVAGVVNPFWEGMIPLVVIMARPFYRSEDWVEKVRYPIKANSSRRSL